MPYLDGECPSVTVAAGQQDVVAGEITMQHICLMEVAHSGSNLPCCAQDDP